MLYILTDIPNIDGTTGSLSIFKIVDGTPVTVVKEVGIVDYEKGELIFGPLIITETEVNIVLRNSSIPRIK